MTDAVDYPHDPGDPRSTTGDDPATGEQAETPDLAVIAGEVLATGLQKQRVAGSDGAAKAGHRDRFGAAQAGRTVRRAGQLRELMGQMVSTTSQVAELRAEVAQAKAEGDRCVD